MCGFCVGFCAVCVVCVDFLTYGILQKTEFLGSVSRCFFYIFFYLLYKFIYVCVICAGNFQIGRLPKALSMHLRPPLPLPCRFRFGDPPLQKNRTNDTNF